MIIFNYILRIYEKKWFYSVKFQGDLQRKKLKLIFLIMYYIIGDSDDDYAIYEIPDALFAELQPFYGSTFSRKIVSRAFNSFQKLGDKLVYAISS